LKTKSVSLNAFVLIDLEGSRSVGHPKHDSAIASNSPWNQTGYTTIPTLEKGTKFIESALRTMMGTREFDIVRIAGQW
jgi:hypothetical protein